MKKGISRKEYDQAVIKQKLKKGLGFSSFFSLVASFCGKENLTEEQKEKVNQLLEEIEKDL